MIRGRASGCSDMASQTREDVVELIAMQDGEVLRDRLLNEEIDGNTVQSQTASVDEGHLYHFEHTQVTYNQSGSMDTGRDDGLLMPFFSHAECSWFQLSGIPRR